MKNAHLKLHSYLPEYDNELNEWIGSNFAVEYDAASRKVRGLFGGPSPTRLFEYKVTELWNDDPTKMGPSYAWSQIAGEESTCEPPPAATSSATSKKGNRQGKRDTTWLSLWARAGLAGKGSEKISSQTGQNSKCGSRSMTSAKISMTKSTSKSPITRSPKTASHKGLAASKTSRSNEKQAKATKHATKANPYKTAKVAKHTKPAKPAKTPKGKGGRL